MTGAPRVAPLTLDETVAAATAGGLPDFVHDLNVFRVLLRHPPLAKALNDLVGMLLFRGALDTRLRELVIMRIGWLSGSVYEWTQHWRIAGLLGVDEADVLAVRDWRASERFDDAARAVLQAVDDTFATNTIARATWQACEAALATVEERLELVAAIGNWRLFATLLNSLQVPLEDGVDPWPPDGRHPTNATGEDH